MMSGYSKPNYTQIPNALIDVHMPNMKEAELRVVLAIARATFGWHKKEDKMSLTQLMEKTGLKRQGVINGIQDGMNHGIIARHEDGMGFVYSLVISDEVVNEVVNEVDQSTKHTSQPNGLVEVNEVDQLDAKLVNEVDTQKKGIKQKEIKGGAPVNKPAAPQPTKVEEKEYNPSLSQAKHKSNQRSPAAEHVKEAKSLGMTPAQFTANTDALLEGFNKKALVDAGDDVPLHYTQEITLILARMSEEFRTVEGINKIFNSWKKNDYRGDTTPTSTQFKEHASMMVSGKVVCTRKATTPTPSTTNWQKAFSNDDVPDYIKQMQAIRQ